MDALAEYAREHGQSLQDFALSILKRQAGFIRNRQILLDIENELAQGEGAGPDAPDAASVLEQARAGR